MCMCVSADIDFSTKLPLTWIFVSLGHLDTEQIEMPFGGGADSRGPKEPCIRWVPDTPTVRGDFMGEEIRSATRKWYGPVLAI